MKLWKKLSFMTIIVMILMTGISGYIIFHQTFLYNQKKTIESYEKQLGTTAYALARELDKSFIFLLISFFSLSIVNELSKLDFIHLNSSLTGSPYILNFSYKDVYSETIMHYLEENEIYVSISSACNDKKRKPERTVLELTKNESLALTSIRLSFSNDNTLENNNFLVNVAV